MKPVWIWTLKRLGLATSYGIMEFGWGSHPRAEMLSLF